MDKSKTNENGTKLPTLKRIDLKTAKKLVGGRQRC